MGFHGEPYTNNRHMKELKPQDHIIWVVMGEFNAIVFNNEMWGGKERRRKWMASFRNALEHCILNDLGFMGTSLHRVTSTKIPPLLKNGRIRQWQTQYGFKFTLIGG